jgi:hypothetical protein
VRERRRTDHACRKTNLPPRPTRLPVPGSGLAKAELARQIGSIVEHRHLTLVELKHSSEEHVKGRIHDLFKVVVERMEPDRVTDARFSVEDGVLWVRFGDGLERAVTWGTLPFASRRLRRWP